MLDFVIDNILDLLGGRVFQQMIGIPKRTNCFPILGDLVINYIAYIQMSLKIKLYDTCNDFTFLIVNFPSLSRRLPNLNVYIYDYNTAGIL